MAVLEKLLHGAQVADQHPPPMGSAPRPATRGRARVTVAANADRIGYGRRWLVALGSSALVIALPLVAQGGPGPAPEASSAGCIAALQHGPLATKSAKRPKPTADDLRPMTDADIRLFLRAFEPVKLKRTEGQAMRWAVAPVPGLSEARFQVLLDDTTLLLATIHTRDLLGEIGRTPGLDPEFVSGMSERLKLSLQAFDMCGELQFGSRGGLPELERSREIVVRWQPELEDAVLGGPGGVDPTAPFLLERGWLDAGGGQP